MPLVVQCRRARAVHPDRKEIETSRLDDVPECRAGRDDDIVTSRLHRISERQERKEMSPGWERREQRAHAVTVGRRTEQRSASSHEIALPMTPTVTRAPGLNPPPIT